MIDNFIEDDTIEYHSYDNVYTHQSGFSIYLGDASAANDLTFIQQTQIGLVVTAASNMEHLQYSDNVKHIVYSLLDSKTQNMTVHFSSFYELIQDYLHKFNILVHCFAGISRSATLVISYVMKKKKLGFKQAIAQIRKYRPTVLPNLGFQRQLKQYQKVLKVQELSFTRKLISKTSQSRKHQYKKPINIALPQIFALGKTLARPKAIQPPPLLQPSSQMQTRKARMANHLNIQQLRIGTGISGNLNNDSNNFMFDNQFKNYQPLTNRLPIKSYRKRSISISNRMPGAMHGSEQQQHQHQLQLVRLPPHKLAVQEFKFNTEKVIKSTVLRDLYH